MITFFTDYWQDWLIIGVVLLAIWVGYRLSWRMAGHLAQFGHWAMRRRPLSVERQNTLRGLFSGLIRFMVIAAGLFIILSRYIEANTLIWMAGLFSAAFGLGARPLVSDFLSGISFMFENTFDVNEKVEFVGLSGGSVEGVIESVRLRTTLVRSPQGELFTVPNGEVRVVRNFSRGKFSTADITLKLAAADLTRALPLLEELGHEAVTILPNLLEPWLILSVSGEMGNHTELTLATKARFGRAAEMRPRLLSLVQERLEDAGIALVD